MFKKMLPVLALTVFFSGSQAFAAGKQWTGTADMETALAYLEKAYPYLESAWATTSVKGSARTDVMYALENIGLWPGYYGAYTLGENALKTAAGGYNYSNVVNTNYWAYNCMNYCYETMEFALAAYENSGSAGKTYQADCYDAYLNAKAAYQYATEAYNATWK